MVHLKHLFWIFYSFSFFPLLHCPNFIHFKTLSVQRISVYFGHKNLVFEFLNFKWDPGLARIVLACKDLFSSQSFAGWSWVTWWWSLVWGMGHQHQCSGVGETRRLHLHMLLLAPKPKHHHTHPNSTHASLHWFSCPQHHVSQCVNPLLLIVFTWTRSDGVWVSCQRFQPTVCVWSVQQLFSRKYLRSLAAKYFYQVIAWRVLCWYSRA